MGDKTQGSVSDTHEWKTFKTKLQGRICADNYLLLDTQKFKPSAQNKTMTAKRSAEYTKGIPTRRLWTLVTMMKDNNMILSSSQIRRQLRGCFPNTMNLSKQMVYQLRLKVWRLYEKFGEELLTLHLR